MEAAQRIQQWRWLIIDEISMVGANKHLVMNYRLQHMAQGPNKNEFMGGKHILAVGDFRQLPPVKDIYIFENARIDGRPSLNKLIIFGGGD